MASGMSDRTNGSTVSTVKRPYPVALGILWALTVLAFLAVVYDLIETLNAKGESALGYVFRMLAWLLGTFLLGGIALFWTTTRSIEKK